MDAAFWNRIRCAAESCRYPDDCPLYAEKGTEISGLDIKTSIAKYTVLGKNIPLFSFITSSQVNQFTQKFQYL